ncbi:MAG: CRISPR-associated helicase Cas3' [Eubacteriaceae bacterium]
MDVKEFLAKPNKSIAEHSNDLIEQLDIIKELGYINDKKLYDLTKIACEYHDIGKRNPEFQKRILDYTIKFNEEKEVSHNVLSVYFLNPQLFKDKDDYFRVAFAILYHHDYCDPLKILGDPEKKELIYELVGHFEDYRKVKSSFLSKVAGIANDTQAIKIKGLLHKCDYSASGGYISEYENNFLEKGLSDFLENLKKKNGNAEWNELQEFCKNNQDQNIIVVAQTGMGKTEAGLHWIGNSKGFFVLPLRTAINAIYDRVKTEILFEKDIEKRLSILHSSSLEYYLNQQKYDRQDEEGVIDSLENILEYQSRGKHLSLPLNISTMDQLFDFVFKYQGYELKLTTLAYSKIVIDEIQMYDPELLAYLIYGLEKIVETGGKIAIMTATLAPMIRDKLEEKMTYKIRTFYDNQLNRHNLKIQDKKIDPQGIFEKYKETKEKGKSAKFLVVCNTVRKAQEVYLELKELFEESKMNIELNLLHSRFIRMDREEKEKNILKFGKTYVDFEDGISRRIDVQTGIWVSTQLVEASLDIDFDFLFTELQDLNSLLQRLGRCNRKGAKDISEANCYVYLKVDEKTLKIGNNGFIDKSIYDLSKEALKDLDGIISEKEKIDLVENTLTTFALLNSDYLKVFRTTYHDIGAIPLYSYKHDERRLRNILSKDIIPSIIYERNKNKIEEVENLLKDKTLGEGKRVQLKEEIYRFVVSVPYYTFETYRKKVWSSKVEPFPEIVLSKYEKIPVMECQYGELGFRQLEYDSIVRPANIL